MTKWHMFTINPITLISGQIFSKCPYVCQEFLDLPHFLKKIFTHVMHTHATIGLILMDV